MPITKLTDNRLPVLVVSHERSGTHFTMNSLAASFGYISRPWLDLDRHQININYFDQPTLLHTIKKLADLRPANILKSHHEFAFFSDIIDLVMERFALVYVHRHPADALASYWRLLNTMHWMEGPKLSSAFEFAIAAPMGRLMRYQYQQYPTMLDRWANHVSGWVEAAERHPRINLVRYEDLDRDFEGTIRGLGERLGLAPKACEAPSRSVNVVTRGPVPFNPTPAQDNRAAIRELAQARHGELMARLGYSRDAAAIA